MHSIAASSKARLACVVDVNEQEALRAANEFGCPHLQECEDAFGRDDVDCVIVSVPNKWHKETVIAAVKAGKHVFCEKPLARNPEEGIAMVDGARRHGVSLKVGSNLRFFPSVLKAWELLQASAIGEPIFLRSWIGHGGWTAGDWYSDADICGGGTFLDNGCHVLDISRWFLGEMKSCIGMVGTYLWPVAPVEDNGFGIFEAVDGKTALVHASWTEWAGYMYLEIYGKEGYIRIDNRGRNCKTVLGRRNGEEKEFDFSSFPNTSYQTELDHYVEATLSGEEPTPSGYDGLRAVQMAWGVYESARLGKKVEI
jgi:predicted dehydrogenase